MNLTNVSGELLNYSVMCDIFFEYVINIRIAFICTVKCTPIDEFYNCRPDMLPKNWPKIKDASLREEDTITKLALNNGITSIANMYKLKGK